MGLRNGKRHRTMTAAAFDHAAAMNSPPSTCPHSARTLTLLIESDPTPPSPATRIALKVVPGSRRAQIVGPLGDRLKIKVASPPEHGRANDEVCALLAAAMGLPARAVTIIAGNTRPEKTARVEGLTSSDVARRLGLKE